MEGVAKLITAIATLLGAIAWPSVFIYFLVTFRVEIRSLASRFPIFMDRLRKMKVAGIEAELDAIAEKASSNGEVTADQARAAAQFAIESRDIGNGYLFAELDKLCLQYDTVRRTMASGGARTHEMTRIVAKMRALGPSTSSKIGVYKNSGSPGSRLAAVTMMQMEPTCADLDWLLERFQKDSPFIFYHAALALTNVANTRDPQDRADVLGTVQSALQIVRSFGGDPDKGTLEVLNALIAG